MTTWQKIYIGTICAVVWVGGIILKHFYPALDSEFSEIIFAAQSVLTGLGVYHLTISQPPKE